MKMKIQTILQSLTISFVLFFCITSSVQAYTVPTFPSCVNPQGNLTVHYSDGVHGIVGQSGTYTGEDDVYQVTDTTVMQCFCPPNGQGIQTNWWNVASLDQSDIQNLQSQDWMYQSQGAYWGLANAPYLAQNSNYSCNKESINPVVTGYVESASVTNPVTNGGQSGSSSNNNTNSSASNNTPQLANTGNIVLIYSLLLSGLVALTVGLLLKKFK